MMMKSGELCAVLFWYVPAPSPERNDLVNNKLHCSPSYNGWNALGLPF